MQDLILRFSQYIDFALGLTVSPEPWVDNVSMPFYLRERYDLYQVTFLHLHCLLVVPVDMSEQTPAVVERHLKQLAQATEKRVIYVRDTISSYDRKRLIERKIPFIVPGNQMYIPYIGVDLREYYAKMPRRRESFSPSAQYLLLYFLQTEEMHNINPTRAAELTGYTIMTMTRAFQELCAAGIGVCTRSGKEQYLVLELPKRLAWEKALPYLQNPVFRKLYVRSIQYSDRQGLALAGQSALARLSMLNEPNVPVYALHRKIWTDRQSSFEKVPYADIGSIELELWRHPVLMRFGSAAVDRLSLYLSLKDNPDERVQAALNDTLEQALW